MSDEECDDCFEYQAYFTDECTCEHDPDQHGWQGCDVEGCDCDAHWEE